MLRSIVALSLLAPAGVAAALEYHTLEARQQNLPLIKLPYGTYQATKYDAASDVYMWQNIRYAAPPVGPLRFAKPAPPSNMTGVQVGGQGGSCLQSLPPSLINGILGPSLGPLANSLLSSTDLGKVMGGAAMSEDCLFLDIYVPGKALKGNVKLPVISWFYGGAYIAGTKDGIYNGTPLIKSSGGNVIFVSSNYRLGALGFLAGTTMEKDKSVATNAGFYDQRAVLEWIRDNVALFGGDPNDVSVWGESAGAGSIEYHLTAFGGKQDPLFKKAVLLSPASNAQYDRKGALERKFQQFSAFAGCAGKGVECLRSVDFNTFKAAQDKYIATVPRGTFGFGPSVDGKWVRQLPSLEFASGNVAKGIESLIVSHVSDEAGMFVRGKIEDDVGFKEYVQWNYGNTSSIVDAILKKYPSPGATAKFKNQTDRLYEYTQLSSFTCHTRWVTEGYKGKTWNVEYAYGSGTHGFDITATFYSGGPVENQTSLTNMLTRGPAEVGSTYQAYLLSHARTGDPNKFKLASALEWPKVTLGPQFSNVLQVNQPFKLIKDDKNKAEDCDFWRDVQAAVTADGGYAPPDSVVKSSLISPSNPSANFV